MIGHSTTHGILELLKNVVCVRGLNRMFRNVGMLEDYLIFGSLRGYVGGIMEGVTVLGL